MCIRDSINPDPIVFEGEKDVVRKEYRYDPRVCFIEDRYYICLLYTSRCV